MSIPKQSLPISFAKGLDLKTDPKQIGFGSFLRLKNRVFNKLGLLEKRNGFGFLPSLPDNSYKHLQTFNGNLTAIGTSLAAYSSTNSTWNTKGTIYPVALSTLPLIRNNLNQVQVDSATAPNGLLCAVYTETGTGSSTYKYAVLDSTTGQNIIAPTLIPASGGGTITLASRVFVLGNYFILVFNNVISATNHLQYIAISTINPTVVGSNVDISTQYTPSTNLAFDGVVASNVLYLAWNGSDGGGAIRMNYLDSSLNLHTAKVFATELCTLMSICADTSTNSPIVYAFYYNLGTTAAKVLAVQIASGTLNTILAPTSVLTTGTLLNVTCSAISGVATLLWELSASYSFDATIPTNRIRKKTCTQAGSVSAEASVIRSLGLASKSFIYNSTIYMLGAYQSTNQPSYFLIDSSGNIISKLAYSNGGGYLSHGLPSISMMNSTMSISYLLKDLVQSVNKGTALPSGTPSAQVYTQTGINLASFNLAPNNLTVAEIGANLNLSGGFLWAYDGYLPVEQGFHLWPDLDLNADNTYHGLSTATGSGGLTAQQYYYAVTYEWSDNQGNNFRSAPSVPVTITTTTSSSTNTLKVPSLRVTAKTANSVKIVAYRWSTAQQTYYQVTSLALPTLNDTTVDFVTITDALADSAIIGNNILYTTGGVIENIGAPATNSVALFKSRLALIDAEDPNLIWFSKQVIEGTPVEMSDLLTIYAAPTIGAQGSTGPNRCLSALDDKLILFKDNAIYYIIGNGPDNTGANNDFSDPVFITSNVGCANQASIVFIPQGLMFQSDKGIWLLGRDLSTQYIGAPVEDFNSAKILSALAIPGTNQVRFTLDTGITLVYDYYYSQWATFEGSPAISSALFQNLHTTINKNGQAFQETPSLYLDGSIPVLQGLTTGWMNMAGLQGFQRAYSFYLLGDYISPHKIAVGISYDYNSNNSQSLKILPDNFNPPYGGDSLYGGSSVYAGNPLTEQWRVFFEQQQCQAFQITIDEIYDPSFGIPAGAGFTLSGINFIYGGKNVAPRLPSSRYIS